MALGSFPYTLAVIFSNVNPKILNPETLKAQTLNWSVCMPGAHHRSPAFLRMAAKVAKPRGV